MSTGAATHRRALCIAVFAFSWLCNGPRAGAEVRWRSVPTHGAEFGLTSVALDPARDRIAAGSTRGLYQGDARGVFDLVVSSEVRDLAFFSAVAEPPVLFVATTRTTLAKETFSACVARILVNNSSGVNGSSARALRTIKHDSRATNTPMETIWK